MVFLQKRFSAAKSSSLCLLAAVRRLYPPLKPPGYGVFRSLPAIAAWYTENSDASFFLGGIIHETR